MATRVFAVEIELNDADSPVTQDTDIGLWNISNALAANASAGASYVTVSGDKTGDYERGHRVYIARDDGGTEVGEWNAVISTQVSGGNTSIYLVSPLAAAYSTADASLIRTGSRFRWIQNDVSGLSGWCSGMIVRDGIHDWVREVVLPGVSSPGMAGVTVTNTGQFNKDLSDRDVYLNGRIFRVYSFSGTTRYDEWRGCVDEVEFTATEYRIAAIGLEAKHHANLSRIVTTDEYPNADDKIIGTNLPVLLGKLQTRVGPNGDAEYYNDVRIVRTANARSVFNNSTLSPLVNPGEQVAFPVVSPDAATANLAYTIQYAVDDGFAATTYPNLVGAYAHSIDGEAEGEYREIESIAWDGTDPQFALFLSEYTSTPWRGNSTATASAQTWISIESIERGYTVDHWPCKGLMHRVVDGVDGGYATDRNPELYAYTKESYTKVGSEDTDADTITRPLGFYRLPTGTSVVPNSDKNSLELGVVGITNDLETVDSFLILPVASPEIMNDANLGDWPAFGSAWVKRETGIYTTEPTNYYTASWSGSAGDLVDRDATTEVRANVAFSAGVNAEDVAVPFRFKLPTLPENFNFDDAYLGIRANGDTIRLRLFVHTMWRRFLGLPGNIVGTYSDASFDIQGNNQQIFMQDLPEWYFDTPPGENSKSFWVQLSSASASEIWRYGYATYPWADIDGSAQYQSVYECLVVFTLTQNQALQAYSLDLHLQELAIILRKRMDISESIYSSYDGRIYNDTWESRKTASDGIDNTLDILEHISRLQCWSETSGTPSAGWGKGYPELPLINVTRSTLTGNAAAGQANVSVLSISGFHAGQLVTIKDSSNQEVGRIASIDWTTWTLTLESNLSNTYTMAANAAIWTEGSFEDENTKAAIGGNEMKAARQVLRYSDADSHSLRLTLCREFFLCTWLNRWGETCVRRVIKEETSPADIITLADITSRDGIRIQYPTFDNIYPEPYVRYQMHYGDDASQKAIRFTNAGALTYSSDYVQGLNSGSETYWNRCQALWQYSNAVTAPPARMTELMWANGEDGDDIASACIKNQIDWSFNPIISFSAHYNTVGQWEEGHEFIVQLPHHTNNAQIECRVIRISVSPNEPNSCQIRAVMFSEDIPEDYDIQDSMTTFGTSRDWQDSVTALGNTNDKEDSL